MSESALILALLAGIALGAIFYGGLWWTVRSSLSCRSLGVWLIGSFLVRAAIALVGFYGVSQGDWRRLLACLVGFLIVRVGVTRLTRIPLAGISQR
jgi:F1F0 ATPase subunit 2